MREPPAVHPFSRTMAHAISSAAFDVRDEYAGDARKIWRPANNSRAEVTERLTKFRQIGRHKAEVATYLLAEVFDELDIVTPDGVEQVCPALLTYLGAQ
ncbi:hypothetical protein Psuf_015880 [Phytohabitans suffuscus]|uniref:HhH-GPD domain-containing protein n=2 Tax=Phytohabitans suffuscus TaxID=624315 RepID=A0A6F8YDT1_9ACTN|nr:hypothetical protein Psuf_015880 [Phytohabitans suffuscus]